MCFQFCKQLFKHYKLPDGRIVHYYQKDPRVSRALGNSAKAPAPPQSLDDYFFREMPAMPAPGSNTIQYNTIQYNTLFNVNCILASSPILNAFVKLSFCKALPVCINVPVKLLIMLVQPGLNWMIGLRAELCCLLVPLSPLDTP